MIPLSNTIPQYMYSSNIIDMPHVFSPRFVTQIFVAGKKTIAAVDIVCFYMLVRVYHWLSTVNCKAVMISGCLLPWHDCHLVQWNTIAAWATIHSGFPVTPNQWKRERLNSEKCLEQPWLSEPPNSGNVSHKPWSSDVELHWGAAIINYVTGPNPLEILDILSYVCTRRCMIF